MLVDNTTNLGRYLSCFAGVSDPAVVWTRSYLSSRGVQIQIAQTFDERDRVFRNSFKIFSNLPITSSQLRSLVIHLRLSLIERPERDYCRVRRSGTQQSPGMSTSRLEMRQYRGQLRGKRPGWAWPAPSRQLRRRGRRSGSRGGGRFANDS